MVCLNEEQRRKDAADRKAIVEHLREQLKQGDKELVWLLAKRENMSPEEAGIALSKLEEDFWASKTGQKMLRDRVERNFPEFIARVPGGMLGEVGLKRHYKMPEPVKLLHGGKRK